MVIAKLGHCCLIIETHGVRIMTDPGSYSTLQNDAKNIDIILITHEHADHFHINSLKQVLANNPKAIIYTNDAVAKLLEVEGIPCKILQHGQSLIYKGVTIEGHGEEHALIYKGIPQVKNTGYMIMTPVLPAGGQSTFFYPGDSFFNPKKPVEILALPVAGPWMKIGEALDYALEIKPQFCFPVHDGTLNTPGMIHRMPQLILNPIGIIFVPMVAGDSHDF